MPNSGNRGLLSIQVMDARRPVIWASSGPVWPAESALAASAGAHTDAGAGAGDGDTREEIAIGAAEAGDERRR